MGKRQAAILIFIAATFVVIGGALLSVSMSSASSPDPTSTQVDQAAVPQGYRTVVEEHGSGKRTIPVQLHGRAAIIYASCTGRDRSHWVLADVMLEASAQARIDQIHKRYEREVDSYFKTAPGPGVVPEIVTMPPDDQAPQVMDSALERQRGFVAASGACTPASDDPPALVGTPIPGAFNTVTIEMSGTAPTWTLVVAVADEFDGTWSLDDSHGQKVVADVSGARESASFYNRALPRLPEIREAPDIMEVVADCTGLGYLTIIAYGTEYEANCDGGPATYAAEEFSRANTTGVPGMPVMSADLVRQMEGLIGPLSTVDGTQLIVVPSRNAGAWRVQLRRTEFATYAKLHPDAFPAFPTP